MKSFQVIQDLSRDCNSSVTRISFCTVLTNNLALPLIASFLFPAFHISVLLTIISLASKYKSLIVKTRSSLIRSAVARIEIKFEPSYNYIY